MSNIVHIVCPHCKTTNRLPEPRLTEQPKCGKCKQDLFNNQPIALTSADFSQHINSNDIPVCVDFWAPWCGPCKMMAPAFAQAAAQLEPYMRLAKVNTEQEQALAAQYAIRSIPTLAIFKAGQEIARQPGAMSLTDIVRWAQMHNKS